MGTIVLCWLASSPPPRLRVENFPLVQIGMTQAEVEELLGGSPGNYGENSFCGGGWFTSESCYGDAPAGLIRRIWCDDANYFAIDFDPQGQVASQSKSCCYYQPRAGGPFLRWMRQTCWQLGLDEMALAIPYQFDDPADLGPNERVVWRAATYPKPRSQERGGPAILTGDQP
jgi:hypothetical protein